MSLHRNGWSWIGQRRPTLEALESRWNPSTVRFHDGTLAIVGTAGNDTVTITDNGSGQITVSYDNTATGGGGQNGGSAGSQAGSGSNASNGSSGSNGGGGNTGGGGGTTGPTTSTFTGVNRVVFLGLGGDDTVNYSLTGELTNSRSILLDLGAGNDTATLDFGAGVADGGRLRLGVAGGRGDDTVTATFGAVAGDVSVGADLGAGNDTLNVPSGGGLTGDARLPLAGDGGGGARPADRPPGGRPPAG